MDSRHLEEFLILLETKSYSAASKKLHIPQSTLNRHINNLEMELGFFLFESNSGKGQLTENGREFAEYAKCIVDLIQKAQKCIADDLDDRTLIIGAIQNQVPYHIPNLIMDFQNQYPDIRLSIADPTFHKSILELREEKPQFLFTREAKCENLKGWKTMLWMEDPLMLLVPSTHPLSSRAEVEIERLKQETFVLMDRDSIVYRLVMDMCKAAGFSPKVACVNRSSQTLADYVSRGKYITILGRNDAMFCKNEAIALCRLKPTVYDNVVLAYKEDAQMSSAARQFLEFIADYRRRWMEK